ncbi:MAG: hypothetical protein C0404_01045 [Verrucomicrobia bacterium]|nr:hypothetical protein [Verrucomicrobiota bacterium]
MMTKLLFAAVLGAALGGAIGYIGRTAGGTCMLTCNPAGGMLVGAIFGVLLVSQGMTAGPDHKLSSNVIEVTNAKQLDALLGTAGPVVLDFYADWCGPCKALKPTISEIADEYAGKAAVAVVNVDRNSETAAKFGISSVPDVRILKNGRETGRLIGLQDKSSYTRVLDGMVN